MKTWLAFSKLRVALSNVTPEGVWGLGQVAPGRRLRTDSSYEPAQGRRMISSFPQLNSVMLGAGGLMYQSTGAKTTQCREKRQTLKCGPGREKATS